MPTDGPRFHPLGPCLQLAELQSRGEGGGGQAGPDSNNNEGQMWGVGTDPFSLVQFHHYLPGAVSSVCFLFVAGRCGEGDTSPLLLPPRERSRRREAQRDRDVDERGRERERKYRKNSFAARREGE